MIEPENIPFGSDDPLPSAPIDVGAGVRFYSVDELLDFPEPEWLVEPFIIEHGITVLFGKPKSLKTFMAISWAAQVDGVSAYISGEGDPRLFGERLHAWEQAAGRSSGVVVHPHSIDVLTRSYDIAEALRTFDSQVRLLIIDTISRNMAGDENSTNDMAAFVAELDKIRAYFKSAILVLHHTGVDNDLRERGSSALRGAVDVAVRCQREGLAVKLSCAAIRDAADFDPVTVNMALVGGQLVAGQPMGRMDIIDRAVADYLHRFPNASQNEVEDAVEGRAADIRRAYKSQKPSLLENSGLEVRPSASELTDAPEASGASRMCVPLRDAPRDAPPGTGDARSPE